MLRNQGARTIRVALYLSYLALLKKHFHLQDEFDDVAASYPSLLALAVRHSLVNPYYRLIWTGPAHMADTLSK